VEKEEGIEERNGRGGDGDMDVGGDGEGGQVMMEVEVALLRLSRISRHRM
jgi:hypothetical protein